MALVRSPWELEKTVRGGGGKSLLFGSDTAHRQAVVA